MASVLAGCAEAAVGHLLYLSSTTVYGAHEDNPAMLTEESPMRPVRGFQYGEDKAESERLLARHLAGNLGLNATVLRACPVLGPTSDNFIAGAFSKPVLVGLWRHDPPVQLVHEDDLVDAMGRCILDRVEGVYNVAGDGSILWSEMGRILGRKRLTLPASLLYPLTQAAWALHLQSDSPASGLDFIRHRWTADTSRLKAALGTASWHSSEEVWRSFARHRAGVRESEQPPRARHRSDPRCP